MIDVCFALRYPLAHMERIDIDSNLEEVELGMHV